MLRQALTLWLAALLLSVAAGGALAQDTGAKEGRGIPEIGQSLRIRSAQERWRVNNETKIIEKIQYSGDVHCIINDVEISCEYLEVVGGNEKEDLRLVAVTSGSTRVVISQESLLIVCDRFEYTNATQRFIWTGKPVAYSVGSGGANLYKNACERIELTRGDKTTDVTFLGGGIVPTTIAKEQSNLPPYLFRRLKEFVDRAKPPAASESGKKQEKPKAKDGGKASSSRKAQAEE